MKPMPFQKICNNMVGVLKRLKPVLDDVMDHQIPSDVNLCKECEELDKRVNEARDFIEKWSPKMSRIHSVRIPCILFVKLMPYPTTVFPTSLRSLASLFPFES